LAEPRTYILIEREAQDSIQKKHHQFLFQFKCGRSLNRFLAKKRLLNFREVLTDQQKEPDLHLTTDGISSSEYDGISSFFVPKAASRRNKTAASGSGY
jgi:hypothetical protein